MDFTHRHVQTKKINIPGQRQRLGQRPRQRPSRAQRGDVSVCIFPTLMTVLAVAVAASAAVVPFQLQSLPLAEALSSSSHHGRHGATTKTAKQSTTLWASTAASNTAAAATTTTTTTDTDAPTHSVRVTTIAEDVWRKEAADHYAKIQHLLEPGLVDLDHPLMRPVRKQFTVRSDNNNNNNKSEERNPMTMLDPKHPIYNFLVEYYGLKGLKGPKRLARWSPSVGLFFWEESENNNNNNNNDDDDNNIQVRRIESLEDYQKASSIYATGSMQTKFDNAPNSRDKMDRRIFLEGATPDDFALTLYLQGAEWIQGSTCTSTSRSSTSRSSTNGGGGDNPDDSTLYGGKEGILYRPIRYYNDWSNDSSDPSDESPEETLTEIKNNNKDSNKDSNNKNDDGGIAHRKATSFLWYKSILESTLHNDPVLHCYGLHEWAMQYHPEGADPPPSGKYQAHLPLRVSRETINRTVERKGLRCTHVDALRFFAPSAGPLNHHGASLERSEQLDLEQPGCVHAHMDLLKIALRIKPYCDPVLLVDVLKVALEARTLDVGASPYDCSMYRCGTRSNNNGIDKCNDNGNGDGDESNSILVIPVETTEGRALYKSLQTELMEKATVARMRLLANYEAFGVLAFDKNQLHAARTNPSDERFAKAEPGGKAWRHNLIDRPKTMSCEE